METTSNEKTKKTSMCLSESTQKALKDLVYEQKLRNQDEAIRFLIAAASFCQSSPGLPNRKQALNDIQDLFRRIMVKITENFDLIADIKADAELEVANKEAELNAKISELEKQLREKEIQLNALKEALASVGGTPKASLSNEINKNNSDAT